jgi:hypothetical protein
MNKGDNDMKAFKGFNKDMTCRGYQYEEGKEYTQEGKIECCTKGFHACEYPLDVFNYYNPSESVFHEVEVDGDIDRDSDDSKVAARTIKIGAELNIAGLVKAAIEYTTSRCDKSKEQSNDADKMLASNSGDYGAASNSGNRGAASNSGNRGAASNSGYCGAAITTGTNSKAVALAKNSLAVGFGVDSKVKGVLGSWIVCAEFKEDSEGNYFPADVKAAKVDGVHIKADTYYILVEGDFIEVE